MPWYARSSERGLKLTGANDILERAIASLSYAKEFSKAASIITEGRLVANMPLIAVTYLYGHAIELALKSILVKNDVIPEQYFGQSSSRPVSDDAIVTKVLVIGAGFFQAMPVG